MWDQYTDKQVMVKVKNINTLTIVLILKIVQTLTYGLKKSNM